MKRLVVISDLHCGHSLGLSPANKVVWDYYMEEMEKLQPIDVCAVNGDAIEGPGKKNPIEIDLTNMKAQRELAIACIEKTKAKDYIFTYGSPYHVTDNENHEDMIADHFKAKIKTSQDFEINGVLFNMKHHTSKTSIPHGQGTLLLKRALWQLIKAQLSNVKNPDIIIRSHIHEFIQAKSKMGFAVTTPALQLDNTIYGRRLDGWYDVGFIHFDIHDDGSYDFQEHILKIKDKIKVVKFE